MIHDQLSLIRQFLPLILNLEFQTNSILLSDRLWLLSHIHFVLVAISLSEHGATTRGMDIPESHVGFPVLRQRIDVTIVIFGLCRFVYKTNEMPSQLNLNLVEGLMKLEVLIEAMDQMNIRTFERKLKQCKKNTTIRKAEG